MLDKVLCCYPEIDTLLQVSLQRTQRLYAVVVPRPHWLVAAVWRVAIAMFKLLRSSFHPFYHDWHRTAAAISTAGFQRIFAAHTLAWEAWIFRPFITGRSRPFGVRRACVTSGNPHVQPRRHRARCRARPSRVEPGR